MSLIAYVMIESRLGFFEAYRHVLVALQKLTTEESYVYTDCKILKNWTLMREGLILKNI